MNRQLVGFALARTARGAIPATIASACFTTASPQAALKNMTSRQSRLAAAASELSSLNDSSRARDSQTSSTSNSNSTYSPRPVQAAGGSNPHFSRAPPSRDAAPDNGAQAPRKIINLRSLPRGGSAGGSGSRFPGPSGVSTPAVRFNRTGNLNPAFQTDPNSQNNKGGRTVGRFVGRSTGPRRPAGSGGNRRSPRSARRRGGDKKGKNNAQQEDEFQYPTQAMRDYTESLSVGQPVVYEPALTLEGLLGSGPAVASAQGNSSRGPVSAVLRSMRVMSGGYAFAGAQEDGATVTSTLHNPELLLERLHDGKTVFFDTADERAMVDRALHSKRAVAQLEKRELPKDTTLIAPLPDAAKEAIMDAAVRGVYETSKAAAEPSGSLLATYHRYQSRSYTYTERQAASFDKKILELLPQAAAGSKSAKGSKTVSKA
ncbi:hypothetical protein SEPCBS119000_005854 [Sporothrix epigloea]|uniref:Uncharacterized protein n=1 Tax=Sporothrix epigloea TaxID=1892477 RepID=A0ABP0E237_9PEZI